MAAGTGMLRGAVRAVLVRAAVVAVAALATTPLVGAGTAGAAAGSARVTLVHGIRGFVADVALDHEIVLSGFKFQHVTGVLDIPAGKHRVQIYPAGTRSKPQLDVSMTVRAGQDITVVAALGTGGKPQAFVFDNDLPAAFSSPRALVLRNAAAAGPVSASIDADRAGPAVAPGEQGVYALPAGTHRVRVANGAGDRVGPAFDAKAAAGRMYSVFVVGGTNADRLFLVTAQQRPAGAAGAVHSVSTGGRPPGAGALDLAAGAAVGAGVVLLALATRAGRRHRRRGAALS